MLKPIRVFVILVSLPLLHWIGEFHSFDRIIRKLPEHMVALYLVPGGAIGSYPLPAIHTLTVLVHAMW